MEEKITAWVARESEDNGNRLHLFYTKPVKLKCSWQVNKFSTSSSMEKRVLNIIDFSQVKWEDKEPTQVELTIKICK